MGKHRDNTFTQLAALDIAYADICTLVRASATLHTWHEHECNGTKQQDEKTGHWYWYNADSGKRICRTPDLEKGARKRIDAVMSRYPTLKAYVQGDPRGCALYILRPGDVPEGADVDSYYSRGIAVIP